MWLVKKSDEAKRYIDENLKFIIELMLSIGRLMFTDNGLPSEGELHILNDRGLYLWEVAGHTLLIEHREEGKMTRIVSIKPGYLDD